MEGHMTAFNIVRFKVKPEHNREFIDYHRTMRPDLKGFKRGTVVKTGDDTFCFVGEWTSFQKIVDARPAMIGLLDGMRHMLDDLGNGLGLTDPVSGETAVEIAYPKPKARAAKRKVPAKKKKAKAKTAVKAKKKRR
jgi:hypothetical protein